MILGRIFCSPIKVFGWSKECDYELRGHLHVWRIYIPNVIDGIEKYLNLLSDNELNLSMEFVQKRDRDCYVLSRIFLKRLISKYMNINPQEVQFGKLEYNKPYLVNDPSLNFNLSHSKDYIIIGIGKRWPVGIDVEYMNTQADLYDLLYNTMSKSEIGTIMNSTVPRESFYTHWTRKEALLKGIGIGLTDRLQDISCNDGLNLVPSDLSSFISTWNVHSFSMDDQYSVSIAHDPANRVIRFYEVLTI